MPVFTMMIPLDRTLQFQSGAELLVRLDDLGHHVTPLARDLMLSPAFDDARHAAPAASCSLASFGFPRTHSGIKWNLAHHRLSFGNLRLGPCLRLMYSDSDLSDWGCA